MKGPLVGSRPGDIVLEPSHGPVAIAQECVRKPRLAL